MKNNPQEILKNLSDAKENLNLEQMEDLLKNSFNFFNELLEIGLKGDQDKQEEAFKEILNFKNVLQDITKKITEETALSPEDLINKSDNIPENK